MTREARRRGAPAHMQRLLIIIPVVVAPTPSFAAASPTSTATMCGALTFDVGLPFVSLRSGIERLTKLSTAASMPRAFCAFSSAVAEDSIAWRRLSSRAAADSDSRAAAARASSRCAVAAFALS